MSSHVPFSRVMPPRNSAPAGTKDTIGEQNTSAKSMSPASPSISSRRPSIPSLSSEPSYIMAHMMNQGCRSSNHSEPQDVEPPCLVNFRSASVQPPITKASLGELDSEHLFDNLLLRHDLNFDPKIQYRPTTHGLRGEIRMTEALEYWNAMGTELAGWFMDQGKSCCCWTTLQSSSIDKRPVRTTLRRLPNMFETVREILKSLLPDCEWSAIDARLDIDLLIQELDNGACDFIALSEWLGILLRRYCSQEGSHLIDEMTTMIRSGVQDVNTGGILNGLMQIFTILEVMKLDHTNHEIRALRPAMVDATVAFEHKDFLRRMTEGWDVSRARIWFVNERHEKGQTSGVLILAPAVTKLIVTNSERLPPTFTLDYIRLRTLQKEFEDLMYQAACRWTLEEVLSSLDWKTSIPQSSYDSLFARISIITSAEESRSSPLRLMEDVALEIVRVAYELCHHSNLPSTKDLDFAESNLEYSSDASTSVFQDLQSYLAEDIQDMVDAEVQRIKDLTPMQIANRYVPTGSVLSSPPAITEQIRVRHLAQQISHISVLHWRVWGPLLYGLPDKPGEI